MTTSSALVWRDGVPKCRGSAHQERGASTAEYSVGTIGTVFIAYWLTRWVGDPDHSWFAHFIRDTIAKALDVQGFPHGGWIWRWLM